MSSLGEQIVATHQQLLARRRTWESHWQDVAELVAPQRADITTEYYEGEQRNYRIYDSKPRQAANQLAAALSGFITNQAMPWFSLGHRDANAMRSSGVRRYLHAATEVIRGMVESNGQQFYAEADNVYLDLAVFGTAVFYSEERADRPGDMFFACRHLKEICIARDRYGEVDTVIRQCKMTAKQVAEMWPDQRVEAVERALKSNPMQDLDLLHAVYRKQRALPDAKTRLPIASVWILKGTTNQGPIVLSESGYNDFPYQVVRWKPSTNSAYGHGPAIHAKPDIQMLQEMQKSYIRGLQLTINPPSLAPDEDVIGEIRQTPGAIIFGGMTSDGRRLIEPYTSGARPDIGNEAIQRLHEVIERTFFLDLLRMTLGDRATATEVLERNDERLRILGGYVARIHTEFLSPLIDRLFAIAIRRGMLPEIPDNSRQFLEGEGQLQIHFVSPMARAQKSADGAAIARFVEAVGMGAQIDPTVTDNLDMDAAARHLSEAYGVPADVILDSEEVQAKRDAREQAQQAQSMMENAQGLASAAQTATDIATQRPDIAQAVAGAYAQ